MPPEKPGTPTAATAARERETEMAEAHRDEQAKLEHAVETFEHAEAVSDAQNLGLDEDSIPESLRMPHRALSNDEIKGTGPEYEVLVGTWGSNPSRDRGERFFESDCQYPKEVIKRALDRKMIRPVKRTEQRERMVTAQAPAITKPVDSKDD